MSYVGRFAPSPTGALHFGSLVAAVASYCDAKANNGKWLLRMEDLDKPREVKGAADIILQTLEAFGFEWNDEVMYQSQRSGYYTEALNVLQNKQLIYPCTCTRKEIADSSNSIGIDGVIYPKTCLKHVLKPNINAAYRVMVLDNNITFFDAIQGEITQNLARDIGDFILKRADGLFAYQLTVVVDDAAQGLTHVVRGADLLDSTPRQIYLQQLLGFATPHYAHIPIAVNDAGEKLSKQTLAEPVSMRNPEHQLFEALSFLGQLPSAELKNATLAEIWHWAIANWQLENVPKLRQIRH
jgi:glutamyl-Q tRNA(Asp) synthetase